MKADANESPHYWRSGSGWWRPRANCRFKSFCDEATAGVAIDPCHKQQSYPYSGMLPGYVEGVWQDEDLHIDLRHLAAAANARMIVATVTGIDADLKQIYFDDRPALRFDVLSINIGGQPNLAMIDGAAKHAIPVKPIAKFQKQFETLLSAKKSPRNQSKNFPKKIGGNWWRGCRM